MALFGFMGEELLRRDPQESNVERARRRAEVGELPEGRTVAPVTDSTRKRFLQELDHRILVEGTFNISPSGCVRTQRASFGQWPLLLADGPSLLKVLRNPQCCTRR